MACVATWSKEDVANWLEQCLQLPYARLFKELDIDGPTLIELNDEKLSALGITESASVTLTQSHCCLPLATGKVIACGGGPIKKRIRQRFPYQRSELHALRTSAKR